MLQRSSRGVAAFSVHGSWISDSQVTEDHVLNANENFRRGDEELCTWVDQAEPRRFVVSFNVEGDNYADAARECLTIVSAVTQIEPRVGILDEIGAADEEGYLVVRAEDFDELQNLAD